LFNSSIVQTIVEREQSLLTKRNDYRFLVPASKRLSADDCRDLWIKKQKAIMEIQIPRLLLFAFLLLL
jgi:hypothetical protein